MRKRKYFGTDGIRGTVGKIPITPDFILKLGWATGKVLCQNGSKKIIIGKDTRISGYMLKSSLEAGLLAAGLSPIFIGLLPTPAIAYLTKIYQVEAGIVISASHNPYYDNGIKIFSIHGTKISNGIEKQIEKEIKKPITCVVSTKLKKSTQILNAARNYIEYCKKTFPKNQSLSGLKIVLDCGNGATYQIAPMILNELGANLITIGCKPNGMNINKNCGTENTNVLKKRVIQEKADIGLAFDGDGDRIIMIDHYGNKINGDQILYIIVHDILKQGKLKGGVVGTLMSNMGLDLAFQKLGIPFIRTKVGDRYILEKLKKKGWFFGAENSGHIILLNKTTTGDAIIAGLQVFSAMIRNNTTLYDLSSKIKLIPQVSFNVHFSQFNQLFSKDKFINLIKKINSKLGKSERIVLRKSGTEPLFRIMIEGYNKQKIKNIENNIFELINNKYNLF